MRIPSFSVILASLIVFVTAGFARAEEPVKLPQQYEDGKYQFSFRYPANWRQIDSPGMAYLLVLAPPVDGFSPNLNIIFSPKEVNPDTYTRKVFAAEMKLMFPDIRVEKFEKRQLCGFDALYVRYGATAGPEMRLETAQYFFTYCGKNFVLTFTEQQGKFARSEAVFDAIAASFVLSPDARPPEEKSDFTVEKSEDGESQLCTDAKYRYRFRFPEGWNATEGVAETRLCVLGKEANGFSANMNLVITPEDPDILTYKRSDLRREYRPMFAKIVFKEFGTEKFLDTEALVFRFTHLLGESREMETKQCFFNRGGNLFILTFADLAENFEQSLPAFEMILESFEFLPEAETGVETEVKTEAE